MLIHSGHVQTCRNGVAMNHDQMHPELTAHYELSTDTALALAFRIVTHSEPFRDPVIERWTLDPTKWIDRASSAFSPTNWLGVWRFSSSLVGRRRIWRRIGRRIGSRFFAVFLPPRFVAAATERVFLAGRTIFTFAWFSRLFECENKNTSGLGAVQNSINFILHVDWHLVCIARWLGEVCVPIFSFDLENECAPIFPSRHYLRSWW